MQISFESRGAEEAKEEEDRGGWGANRRESGAINANFRNIFPVKVIRTDSSSDVGTIIVEFNYSVIRANRFCFDEWIGFCFSFLFVFFKGILKIFKIDRGKNGLTKKNFKFTFWLYIDIVIWEWSESFQTSLFQLKL